MEPELIDLTSDHYFMSEALRQAMIAYQADEVPIGAVVVHNEKIIARAYNQVELLKDATAHAEMISLTQAQQVVDDWRLLDCTIYVTKEPCPMCAGALMLSRIKRVVFGAPDPKSGGAGGLLNILQNPSLNHTSIITPGVKQEECTQLLRHFFAQKRQKPKNQ